MKKRFILLMVICFSSICAQILGQTAFPKFYHLTRNNGLPSNRVNCIAEDKQGFIWFGTEDGLSKYNGYDFEVYRNLQGLNNRIPDNAIDFILEDQNNNNLWLATRKGLVYFDRIYQKFEVVISSELEDSTTGNINITSLCFDDANNLWIGTFKGIYVYNLEHKKLFSLNHIQNKGLSKSSELRVYTLFKDNRNDMWVGYEEGLLKFNKKDSSFVQYFKEQNLRSIQTIFQDSKSNYWVGSDKLGLYFIKNHPDKGITRNFCKANGDFIGNRVHGIIEDDENKFLIMVRDGGLYYYDQVADKMEVIEHDIYNLNSINSSALISGFKSSNGIIWLGTYNSGVNYIDKAAKKFAHFKVNFKENGLFNNNIRALLEDEEGYIWIGTKEGGGLSRYDMKLGNIINYKKTTNKGGLTDDYIFSLCELNKRQILIGTFRNGVALFDKNTERFSYFTNDPQNLKTLSDNRVYSIFKDIQGSIWVGNYTHLQQFNLSEREFVTVANIERPRCFCDEDEDRLWVGSKEHGLYLFNKISGKNINYLSDPDDVKSISSNDIYALKKDSKGNLWIATKQGLNKFDSEKGEFIRYTENDGLSANWICALLIDDNDNIWVSTSNGISKFDVNSKEFHNYDMKDGLQGNEFEGYVALKTHTGDMLFGGRNGFNMFNPNDITDNKTIPAIVLTGFKIFNKELPIGSEGWPLEKDISFTNEVMLKHNQSAISIDYVALNYSSPEKNHYAYKLEGFDNEWIQAGTQRTAVYTNILPGTYTFKVKGSNNDNYWNEEGASLQITVLNPYWKTLWAYLFYVFVLGILLYFTRLIIESRIKQQNMLNFERIDKKRIQEMNQLKLRFFTNISHEFRTPLTLISGPLEKLMSYKNDNDEQKYLYKIMQNNVQRLLTLVNELMDFRKAEHGELKLHIGQSDMVVFVQQIVDCFEETAQEKNIKFTFDYQLKTQEKVWFDKSVIDKVIFNLLSNSFKHTPIDGTVSILMTLDIHDATIQISDSGKGIPADQINHIFERFYQVEDSVQPQVKGTGIGLAFSKRLMELHQGTINVASEPNQGTVFTISFPVNKSDYNEKYIIQNYSEKAQSINPEHLSIVIKDQEQSIKKATRTEKLLIVEDNIELREFLKNSFNQFEVITAENGKEGYAIANSKIPDIIISDIMMPQMNGLELCKKLKTQFATSHIPIILLTAKTEISQKIEGIETGADAYIEKPFDINYLEARINNLLIQRASLRKRYANEADVDVSELVTNIHEKKFIDKVSKILDANIANPDFSVETFGYELGLSRSQLFRKFKSIYELKPSEFIRNERLKFSKKLLIEGNYNVNEIADLVGFKSASYYITSFKKYYGKTPVEFATKK